MAQSPYREQAPDSALAQWVECWWRVFSQTGAPGYSVLPDGCLDIIYSRTEGLRAIGAMTAAARYDLAAGAWTVGVRFQPGLAGPFLRAAPRELTDLSVALDDLWGSRARALRARLDDASTLDEALAQLQSALRVPAERMNSVQQAIECIAHASGNVDLDFVARHANLSPRQFRRRCLEESGLTPKHLCRVLRFRRACRLAGRTPKPDWSGIALEAGYYDQSHLIRDVRMFTGRPPVAVFSNTPPPGIG